MIGLGFGASLVGFQVAQCSKGVAGGSGFRMFWFFVVEIGGTCKGNGRQF